MISVMDAYRVSREVYRSRLRSVFRAIRNKDGEFVILKTLPGENPSTTELDGLRHEYEMLRSLDIGGVARAYALEESGKNLALILEDTGGEPLRYWMDSKMSIDPSPYVGSNRLHLDLSVFLKFAIRITETVTALHKQHIVNKDINPQNLMLNPASGEIKLIDFSISARLQETQKVDHYYRADLYSLGVIFYEMLTGQLPFRSADPLELSPSHIERVPAPLQEINPDIPGSLAEIVLKLMANTPGERYDSAFALKEDLELCLQKLPLRMQIVRPEKMTERERFLSALKKTNWVVGGESGAAKILGLSRASMLTRMKKLGIEKKNRS